MVYSEEEKRERKNRSRRERYTKNPEYRQNVNEYNKLQRLKHPERYKKSNKLSYEKSKDDPIKYNKRLEKQKERREIEDRSEEYKSYYERNKEKECKRKKIYRYELKLEVLNYYSKGYIKCKCCDITNIEFLTVDHINGNGNKHRKEIGNIYLWIKRNNFPEGFRVLCMNCNFSYGHCGYCPHQKNET